MLIVVERTSELICIGFYANIDSIICTEQLESQVIKI